MPTKPTVLYETAKTRSTGAHTQVLDLRPDGKFALRCETHNVQVDADRRLPAEAESHRPQDWCPKCKAAVKTSKVTPAKSTPKAAPAKKATPAKASKATPRRRTRKATTA